MQDDSDMIDVKINIEQSRVYEKASTLVPIALAARHADDVARDLAALRRNGDNEDAMHGAAAALLQAVLTLVAIPARSTSELRMKQRCLVTHHRGDEFAWLHDDMIGASLHMDYRALDLPADQEQQLKSMLPLEPAGEDCE